MYLPISWILVLLAGFSSGYYLRYLPKTHQLFSKSESFQKHIDDAMNLLNGTTAEPATLYRIAFALAQNENEAELNKKEELFNLSYTFAKREAEAAIAFALAQNEAELNKKEELFNLNYTFAKREAEAAIEMTQLRSHYLKKLSFISQRYDD